MRSAFRSNVGAVGVSVAGSEPVTSRAPTGSCRLLGYNCGMRSGAAQYR